MRSRVATTSMVALTPIVVLVVRAVQSPWLATDDQALIELRTRAVGTSHTPLVGPYSRFGWNHPGPALFFALAAPYRLLSSHSRGLLVGAALIAGLSIVAIVVTLLGGHRLAAETVFAIVVVAVLVRALGTSLLWDPWNPYVIVLPFLALVLLSWRAAAGSERALPVVVLLVSFVAQTHVALAPEAVAVLVVATAGLWANARRADARARLRRSALVSLAVFAVMWSLPIYEQLRPRGGGNLGRLWQFWTTDHANTLGFARATRFLAPQFAIPAPWMTGHEHAEPFSGALSVPGLRPPLALLVLLVATFVAWRRHDRTGLAACAVAVTVAVVGLISIARIVDLPYPYLVRWAWVVGATSWVASGIALLPPIAARLGTRREAWLTRALVTVAAVLLVAITIDASSAAAPRPTDQRVVRVILDQAIPQLRGLAEPILVEAGPAGWSAWSVHTALVASAVAHGIDARFPLTLSGRGGADRAIDPDRAETRVFIAVGDLVAEYRRNPSYRQIARYDRLTAFQYHVGVFVRVES